MNETVLTISLLIIVVCNLGVLMLWFRTRAITITVDFADSGDAQALRRIESKLDKFIRNTDYDFRALKTRERNQEKVFQEAKRREVQS